MSQANKVYFRSKGETCTGLYYPAAKSQTGGTQQEYCIVLAHGLCGVKEMRLDAYAERFAQAGYNALVFDYRHFGESEGEPRQLLSIPKQHEDWLAAIEYIMTEKKFRGENIVLWGSSLSGGHVMEIAYRRQDIAAIVAQVPHVNGLASGLAGDFITTMKLSAVALQDYFGSLFGKQPYYVNASGQPGDLALMTAEGEADGYIGLVPERFKFDQRVAARFVLSMSHYNPGKKLRSLKMPALVQVGLKDKTTPAQATIKDCSNAGTVQLKTYDLGHFEPYIEPDFSTFIADQIEFLNNVTQEK